jgi:hypothetical protein
MAGAHATDSVYLPVATLTISAGDAPPNVCVTEVPDGSETVQLTAVGSAAACELFRNVLLSSAISLTESKEDRGGHDITLPSR